MSLWTLDGALPQSPPGGDLLEDVGVHPPAVVGELLCREAPTGDRPFQECTQRAEGDGEVVVLHLVPVDRGANAAAWAFPRYRQG